MTSKPATIKDVARLAKASPATVSRVLNASGPVADETRSRVETVISSLGYVPMFAAKQMRGRAAARTVAIIVNDFLNAYFHQFLAEMEPLFREAGMTFLVASLAGQDDTLPGLVRSLKRRGVGGIIMSPLQAVDELDTDLRAELDGYPAVILDQTDSAGGVCSIRSDGRDALATAVRHLVGLGHRDIGCIGPSPDISAGQDRISGYRQAMADAGLACRTEWLFGTTYTFAGGQAAGHALLALKHRPSAVVAASDLMALGFMAAAMRGEVRVPEHLSVIGYDNLWLGEVFDPPLTTVSQDIPTIARAALSALHAQLTGRRPTSAIVPTHLIIRGSTATASSKRKIA